MNKTRECFECLAVYASVLAEVRGESKEVERIRLDRAWSSPEQNHPGWQYAYDSQGVLLAAIDSLERREAASRNAIAVAQVRIKQLLESLSLECEMTDSLNNQKQAAESRAREFEAHFRRLTNVGNLILEADDAAIQELRDMGATGDLTELRKLTEALRSALASPLPADTECDFSSALKEFESGTGPIAPPQAEQPK